MPALDLRTLAAELLVAQSRATTTKRPSSLDEKFDLAAGYAVGAELLFLKRKNGHQPVGRKNGLTNPAMWPRLGLNSLVWSYVYDNTVHYATDNKASLPLTGMIVPKIEPEIVFKLKSAIPAGADAAIALAAVEWFALGFEIVDCLYPEWRFRPADMVAGFGFHAALIIGEPQPLTEINTLVEQLPALKLNLYKNGQLVAEGSGQNVLGSPALSLANLAQVVSQQTNAEPLGAGEVVTSGTLTDAMFVAAGEEWSAQAEGIAVPGLTLSFS